MVIPEIAKKAVAKATLIIEGYEGLSGYSDGKYYPYHCKADKPGVMTIGRGHMISAQDLASGRFKNGLTLAEVDELFINDMSPRIERLHLLLNGKYTENQFAGAFAMFFNNEESWFNKTPGVRHRSSNFKGCAEAMLWYVVSNNKKQLGLWRRRMTEALCYLTGEVMIAKEPIAEAKLEKRLSQLIAVKRPVFPK